MMIFDARVLILAGALGLSPLAMAEEGEEKQTYLPAIEVFGTGVETLGQALNPARVGAKKIEQNQYTDVHRALKNSPGIYLREEDGQGLRPNIGLRGTSPDRSKKIVLLQDGVLIGPAPYSAPAAYYTPSMNHTERLEIRKGFTALPYGPNSIGGAVDYISTQVPLEKRGEIKANYGSFNTHNLKVGQGGPLGRNGYLLESSHRASDGFKKLDGGGDTGFEQFGVFGKWDWKLSERLNILFTGGYSNENSKETYLGLTRADFGSSPYRRYAASQLDEMKWNHSLVQARGNLQTGANSTLEATLYRHDFDRNWYRLDGFRNTGVNLRDILNNPSGGNAAYYDIVRGAADTSSIGANGELKQVRNRRTYFSHGAQLRWFGDFKVSEEHRHSPEFGLRWHQDAIVRDHTSDHYEMLSGRLLRTSAARQTDAKSRGSATAVTVTALDNWRLGTRTLTPIVRFESIDFRNKDSLTGSSTGRTDSFWLPGFSVTETLRDRYAVRMSVNEAATATGVGSAARERATNYEAEFSYKNPERNQEFQLVYFFNDYRNITGTCTVSSGCLSGTDEQFSGGRARVEGVELSAAKGFHSGRVYIPVQANVTLLKTEFLSDFNSTSPEWGSVVRRGDPLPYIPEAQFTLSVGVEVGRFKQDLTLSHQSKVYDQSAQSGRQEIAAFGVVDWAGEYALNRKTRVLAKIDNVLAREYAVAARPFGFRPGKPQSFQLGLVYGF